MPFHPASQASGDLVFLLSDTTTAGAIRHYRLLFDVVGGCPDRPPAAAVPQPVSLDSTVYENQMTYVIATPGATYRYDSESGDSSSDSDSDAEEEHEEEHEEKTAEDEVRGLCLVVLALLTLPVGPESTIQNELTVDRDIMVLANPEIAGLPDWVIALVAAAGRIEEPEDRAALILAELERREAERDREPGTARYQYERVHAHGLYDVEVDTLC